MIAYEFKGGTGTASRRVGDRRPRLHPRRAGAGKPRHPRLADHPAACRSAARCAEDRAARLRRSAARSSSCSRTDLPLSAPACAQRLARRAAIGIGRGGTPGGNNSGDIFLAFSTANLVDLPQASGPWRSLTWLNDELLDPVYLAAVEAVDEAVLNALLSAKDVPTARPAGAICAAINPDRLLAAVSR